MRDHVNIIGDTLFLKLSKFASDMFSCCRYDVICFHVAGMTSWRDAMAGSWFIQTLCEVLMEKGAMWNLMDMLLEVNNKIAFKQGRVDENTIAKQMSNLCDNTLRKQLRFFSQGPTSWKH